MKANDIFLPEAIFEASDTPVDLIRPDTQVYFFLRIIVKIKGFLCRHFSRFGI